jgi:hypothetical protein
MHKNFDGLPQDGQDDRLDMYVRTCTYKLLQLSGSYRCERLQEILVKVPDAVLHMSQLASIHINIFRCPLLAAEL